MELDNFMLLFNYVTSQSNRLAHLRRDCRFACQLTARPGITSANSSANRAI